MAEILKAVAYARFSSDLQREESIDAQIRAIKQFAEQNGYALQRVYADEHAIIGTSGENLVKSRVSALVPFNFFVKGKYNFI